MLIRRAPWNSTRTASISGRVLRFCWSFVSWITLTALIAVVLAGLYYYHRVDDELRSHVQQKLSDHYQDLSISIGSAQLLKDEGIRLRQLTIAKPATSVASRSEIAFADEITLRCDPTIQELLKGRTTIESIVVKGLVLHATRHQDGSWNLHELMPPPRFNPRQIELPTVTIENGTILYSDQRHNSNRVVKCQNVDLQVKLKRLSTDPTLSHQPMLCAYRGTLTTAFCRQIVVQGVSRTSDGVWSLNGSMNELKWTPELIGSLPSETLARLNAAGNLRADAQIRFQLTKTSGTDRPKFRINGTVSQGQWQHPRFPQPLSNVTGEFHVDHQGIEVKHLSATLGEGHISSSARIRGYDLTRPYSISLTAEQFPITRRLVDALPAALRKSWAKHQALGIVSGRVHVSSDGQTTRYDADLSCHDLSLLHHKYSYPITGCRGYVKFRDDILDFELNGLAGSTPISVSGVVADPHGMPTGWWEVKTAGWKEIDEALIKALPAKAQTLARNMAVRGKAGFWARFNRSEPSPAPPQPHLIVTVHDGWVNYQEFPYPISEIRGKLEWKNGDWTFSNLEGWNDGCRITCEHGSWLATQPGRPLNLEFNATNVALDAELKRALRPNAQRIWSSLDPRGTLEQLRVRVHKTDAYRRPLIDVTAVQRPPERQGEHGASIEIQPTWFPYALSRISGHARWQDGSLTVRQLTASRGKTMLRTNLNGGTSPDGSWHVNLTGFSVDNLRYDEPLARALPEGLARALNRAQVAGVFSINDGAMHFARPRPDAPIESGWDVQLQLEQASFNSRFPVEHIFGEIGLQGNSTGSRFRSRGALAIDSMFCNNLQLTQVRGPLWIDSKQLALGRYVPRDQRQPQSPPIIGSLYGGRISADGQLSLDADAGFATRVQMTSADMAAIARDLRMGNGNLSGKAFAELVLTGSARGSHTLNGQGAVQLRNANMYELPLVLELLNRISSGKTNNVAFTNCDIAYRVRDGYVYFDQFDLGGDTITLKGKGDMSLQRELNLDLYTIMGREQLWSPLVRPFLGEASRRILQIHVDGTLENPVTRQEVLPGLNDTLRQLFPELIERAGPQPAATRTGRRLIDRFR